MSSLPVPCRSLVPSRSPRMVPKKGSESRMTPTPARSAHVEESKASSSDSDLFAAFIARRKFFNHEQNRLQDQVDTLGRRSKWLKTCMDEQSEDGLRSAKALKTCIGKTSELQRALHDRRDKRETLKALNSEIGFLRSDETMVWNEYQNTEHELHECKQRMKSLLRQLSEESKAKGSASEQHKTTSKVRNNIISYNFCHS
ncbi:uncharacterized protein LOC103971667 isoform X1 [Musa acuminata AAA Group]|nr:PREDICTED: uncharacterized protein LOC103971667 isoform X1 [Musa acuminata subsp. malaccensis]